MSSHVRIVPPRLGEQYDELQYYVDVGAEDEYRTLTGRPGPRIRDYYTLEVTDHSCASVRVPLTRAAARALAAELLRWAG